MWLAAFFALLFPLLAAIKTLDMSCAECCDVDPPPCCGDVDPPESLFVSGLESIGNGTCSECLDYNSGPIELAKIPGECRWEATGFGGCGPTPSLEAHADGSATLTIGGAIYTIAEFDCDGNNTFTLDSAGTECEDWPPELEIDRASVDECGGCPGGAAAEYSIEISGLSNGDCNSCGSLNGTHILAHTTDCNWEKLLPTGGNCGIVLITLTIAGGTWSLLLASGGFDIAFYQGAVSSEGCLAPTILTRVDTETSCSGLPATITVQAA